MKLKGKKKKKKKRWPPAKRNRMLEFVRETTRICFGRNRFEISIARSRRHDVKSIIFRIEKPWDCPVEMVNFRFFDSIDKISSSSSTDRYCLFVEFPLLASRDGYRSAEKHRNILFSFFFSPHATLRMYQPLLSFSLEPSIYIYICIALWRILLHDRTRYSTDVNRGSNLKFLIQF